ncbi:VOC family protein [Solibacillus sp. FSL R7-0682]|uniref:VOC family protein n=1 Tax=Solibacillus sp. FSL R7-0682 TaxID=2921690 RepID=UPI0030F8251C
MKTSICVISIYVPDISKAIDFYTNVLGFEISKHYGPKIVSLLHGDLPIVLEENDKTSTNSEGQSPGIVLGLQTENIEETVAFLKDANVEFIIDVPTSCPPGKFIRIKDPFGNVLEYLQFES